MNERPYTILIIDDEEVARETLRALLTKPHYRIETAEDGMQGLDMAKQIQPDLILLDVMMPRMNGYDVCQRIRADLEIGETPIIMITALDDEDSKLSGLTAGADDFLAKPFNKMELEIRLHTLRRVDRYRHLLDERQRLEVIIKELHKKNAQLRELSSKIIQTQESERRRIAIELHDEIGQIVTALKMTLDANQHNPQEALAKGREITAELFQRVREMSLNLRPSMLDDLGLFAALDELFKRFENQTGVAVHHNINKMDERRFDGLIEISAFRVIQESLTNVARYANVKEVSVNIAVSPEQLKVEISDAGAGFDLREKNLNVSTGLSGMAERVRMAGGMFSIQSEPGKGAQISAEFNLTPARAQEQP
ncbi:MAG: hypothetical protein Fur002_00910 [Anaerolineales bacterium]